MAVSASAGAVAFGFGGNLVARPTLYTHRKLFRLAALLGGDEVAALGHLEWLWRTAYESGEEVIGDAVDVEVAAKWRGPSGALVKALLDAGGQGRAGFLDVAGEVEGAPIFKLHDFWDHAPEYVARRRKREQDRRARGRVLASNGDRIQSADGQRPATDRTVTSQRPDGDQSVTGKKAGLVATPSTQHPAPSTRSQHKSQDRTSSGTSTSGEGARARGAPPLPPDVRLLGEDEGFASWAAEVIHAYREATGSRRVIDEGERAWLVGLYAGGVSAEVVVGAIRGAGARQRMRRKRVTALRYFEGAVADAISGGESWSDVPVDFVRDRYLDQLPTFRPYLDEMAYAEAQRSLEAATTHGELAAVARELNRAALVGGEDGGGGLSDVDEPAPAPSPPEGLPLPPQGVVAADARQLWNRLKRELAHHLSADEIGHFIRPLDVGLDGLRLVLTADAPLAEVVESHYRPALNRAIADVAGPSHSVVITARAAPS